MIEVNDQAIPFYAKRGMWAVIVVGAFFMIWLWASWRTGQYPFAAPIATTPADATLDQTQADILRSLTATEFSTTSPVDVLKSLTATSKSRATNTAEILDSLTPPKN